MYINSNCNLKYFFFFLVKQLKVLKRMDLAIVHFFVVFFLNQSKMIQMRQFEPQMDLGLELFILAIWWFCTHLFFYICTLFHKCVSLCISLVHFLHSYSSATQAHLQLLELYTNCSCLRLLKDKRIGH